MEQIREAILEGASGADLGALAVPDHYRAAFVRREDVGMFDGIESPDKDPRKSLHVADLAVVKANQLMPKPAHLTWEEAAVNALCNSTSYRMLVGEHGARMKQGDVVLVWGASGGIGGYAVQYVLNGGGTPVGVVSSPEKAALLDELGVEAVIDRKAEAYRFWKDEHTQDEAEWRRFGKQIR